MGAVVSDETVRDVIGRRWGRGVVSFVRRKDTDLLQQKTPRLLQRRRGRFVLLVLAVSWEPDRRPTRTPSSEFSLDRVLKLTCLRMANAAFRPSGAVRATSRGSRSRPCSVRRGEDGHRRRGHLLWRAVVCGQFTTRGDSACGAATASPRAVSGGMTCYSDACYSASAPLARVCYLSKQAKEFALARVCTAAVLGWPSSTLNSEGGAKSCVLAVSNEHVNK